MKKGNEMIMQARLDSNLSMEKLASLCFMSCSNLYNIETGQTKKPKIETLFGLSQVLNLDLKKLAAAYNYKFTELSYKLVIARLEANLCVKELAILCQINFYDLVGILNGNLKPRLKTLYTLSKALNLDFKELMILAGYPFSELAYHVITARLESNLSLAEFSVLSGISQTQLYRIENSKVQKPKQKTLLALANHTPLSLEDLKQLCA